MKYPDGMSVIITDNAVTIDYDGEMYTTRRGVRTFAEVMNLLMEWNTTEYGSDDQYEWIDAIIEAFEYGVEADMEAYLETQKQSDVEYDSDTGQLTYRGDEVRGPIARRIRALANNKLPIDNLLKFLENLYQNPSYASVNQLYGFLEAHDMPISDDGCFVAYKVINSNFTDCHSGTIDNSVGQTVSMPRHKVEDNPSRTCSSGLHVCAHEYAKGFFWGAGRVLVAVKVNPRDVVSVPTDYNNAKMRVCQYTVDRVLEKGPEADELTGRVYYGQGYIMCFDQDPLEDDYDSSWLVSEDADGYPEDYDDQEWDQEGNRYW